MRVQRSLPSDMWPRESSSCLSECSFVRTCCSSCCWCIYSSPVPLAFQASQSSMNGARSGNHACCLQPGTCSHMVCILTCVLNCHPGTFALSWHGFCLDLFRACTFQPWLATAAAFNVRTRTCTDITLPWPKPVEASKCLAGFC